MPSPERRTKTISSPEADALPAGALSALLERLAAAPATPLEEGWSELPRPGARIGRFELVREVGRGGFGVVFEARDLQLPRSVAFKLVRPGHIQRAEEQLKHEADAIAQLSHPNLVTLFDVGRCDSGPYLILEYLQGETLEQRLRRGALPAQEAIERGLEVARGMGHAHARGVVHRDLKPSNVFLCEGGQLKLLDFGMSHAFGRQRISGGTPGYMAPEQWRGEPEDQRTDVYALGVMLFQMLTGRLPFPDDPDGVAAMSAQPAPRVSVPGAPGLSTLVRRMLEKQPERRPADAAAVVLELEQARRAPPLARVRPRPWANPWWWAGLAALVAVAAVGSTLYPKPGRPAGPAARAIAVLPFNDLSGSAEGVSFGSGLTEEILHLLTRVRDVRVAAGAGARGPGERRPSAEELAKRLGVDAVLEGSVRRDREKLRVSAELVDARTGFRLWSQIYDRRLADGFTVQEDLARQVVGAVELLLAGTVHRDLDRPAPASLAAYDLYLRARSALRQPSAERPISEAIRLFESAVAADPAFAVAYAGLCDAWLAEYEHARSPGAYEKAEQACQRAREKEPNAGAVFQALGRLHLAAGDAPRAEKELAEAVERAINPVEALLALASAQDAQGRLEEALATGRRAGEIDREDWRVPQRLGVLLFKAGRHAEAVAAFAEVVSRTPQSASAHANLGGAQLLAGDLQGAAASLTRSLGIGESQVAFSNLGLTAFYRGRFEEAAVQFRHAVDMTPEDFELWGNLADALYYAPGRSAEAAEAYRKALALATRQLGINPEDASARGAMARYQARLGDVAAARRLIAEALRTGGRDFYVQYDAAQVSLASGDREGAVLALQRAVALGYPVRLLLPDVQLAPLQREPGFRALTAAAAH